MRSRKRRGLPGNRSSDRTGPERSQALPDQLAREEARRRKVAISIVIVVVAVVAVVGLSWWISTLKKEQEKTAVDQDVRLTVERFVNDVFQELATSPESIKRYWEPGVQLMVRSAGDARIKAIEKPAGVVVAETRKGDDEEIYEATCREETEAEFLVRVRYRDGSCRIIAIE